MKIAIHNSKSGFHPRWMKYCEDNEIPYKIVNCYDNDIVRQLEGCKALMWHFSQGSPKDIIVAKQILFALQHTGFKVFPDFYTSWHFDDKVAQKYLFERTGLPFVSSYVFFDKNQALKWVSSTTFPKVFKLRGGAGSSNVKLARNRTKARRLVKKAFDQGFRNYDRWENISERWRKWRLGKTEFWDVCKGVIRLMYIPDFAKIGGKERGYVYFQDFIPNNDSDIRIIVIDNKAFGLKRMVRKNDFRASGSGDFKFDRKEFDERCVKLAFQATQELRLQCAAFDFVFDSNNHPLIVEVSYGFVSEGYDPCPGYWDKDLNWHEGRFNPQGWMVEAILTSLT